MTFDELEESLIPLMSFPLKSQVKVDFDDHKKVFSLSIPIFRSGKTPVPSSVQSYVMARAGMSFQPHVTSYRHREAENLIQLIQEIPFTWGFQAPLRQQVVQFWELAKRCHVMLAEIAAEEKVQLFKEA